MTTATHMMVGGAVGSLVGEPAVGFALGVASHIPLDALPHFDLSDYRHDVAIASVIAAVLLGGLHLQGGVPSSVFWGMVGGVLPDVENLLWHMGWMREERRIFPTHRKGWIKHGAPRGISNMVWQALLCVGSVWTILR